MLDSQNKIAIKFLQIVIGIEIAVNQVQCKFVRLVNVHIHYTKKWILANEKCRFTFIARSFLIEIA